MNIPDEVLAGAAYLDNAHPDWLYIINPITLDVAHGARCPLAQIDAVGGEGTYSDYMYTHCLSSQWAVSHGFRLPETARANAYEDQLLSKRLNDCWRMLIDARRRAASFVPELELAYV